MENVAFTDVERKLLATVRSGGANSYPVVSLIGTQGFVDVHIPAGVTSGISLLGNSSMYKIYNLKTGALTTTLTGGNAPLARIYFTTTIVQICNLCPQSNSCNINKSTVLGCTFYICRKKQCQQSTK
ncbi:hypothetical protein [Flavobacterium poyangense]|uniref:hypothetical protein n=1 Tax=Flavobacterium poyangense TaxID=2204302 RepID=UPI00141F4CE6|nr:hypothetical protein [Flavobacterium sp. JXAS1]